MLKDDRIRLQHMLEAAREALAFAEGKIREDLEHNRMLTLSLIRCLEIIGEAATRVSTETRELSPHIPWAQIVGMRNRLIHAYFDINLNLVWDTLADDLPPLVQTLTQILAQNIPPEPPQTDPQQL